MILKGSYEREKLDISNYSMMIDANRQVSFKKCLKKEKRRSSAGDTREASDGKTRWPLR
jgi:hypothetical protein